MSTVITSTNTTCRADTQDPITSMENMVPNLLQNENSKDLSAISEDSDSFKSQFGWKNIDKPVPYITRIIGGEKLQFVSVRMAESQFLTGYMQYLNADIFRSCTSVNSYFISESEARLLNHINIEQCNNEYGKDEFTAGKDYIVHLKDAIEFHKFSEVCYKKLKGIINENYKENFGLMRLKNGSILPYYKKGGQKYVPLYYLEGNTDNLLYEAIRLENWDLAYFKFCCKVHGAIEVVPEKDLTLLVKFKHLEDFIYGVEYNEFWPSKSYANFKKLLSDQKIFHPSGIWIKTPSISAEPINASIPEKSIPLQSSPPSTPVIPPLLMSMMKKTKRKLSMESKKRKTSSFSVTIHSPPLMSTDCPQPMISGSICNRSTLKKIPEIVLRAPSSSNDDPYKILKLIVRERLVYCINFNPYTFNNNLLVIVDCLIKAMFLKCTVDQCAFIMKDRLKIPLFCGNYYQSQLLRKSLRLAENEAPLARLSDVNEMWPQIENLANQLCEPTPYKRLKSTQVNSLERQHTTGM